MMVMMILALLCAFVLAVVLHPLMRDNAKLGWRVMRLCGVGSLGLYLCLGSPDLASSPALFEQSGPRHEQRLMQQRELIVMEALAGEPKNVKLLLELGIIRIEENRPEDALEVLEQARILAPHDAHVAEAVGAAHYNMAMLFAMQPRPEAQKKAKEHLAIARRVTPKPSELYKHLKLITAPGP